MALLKTTKTEERYKNGKDEETENNARVIHADQKRTLSWLFGSECTTDTAFENWWRFFWTVWKNLTPIHIMKNYKNRL